MFVGCLTSQQHASVSQLRICTDNFTCCHTEIEVADPTFYLTQSQYTDTGPTSPSADPITPGAWQGSHWSANFSVTGMTRPRKIPSQAGFEPGTFRSRGGRLNHWANEADKTTGQLHENRPGECCQLNLFCPTYQITRNSSLNAPVEKHQNIAYSPAHSTTKQGSRYGPLACPSKPCKLCGVCRGFVPDIQVCGTLGREDLVNATITIERRRRTQSVVFAPGFLFRWPILLRIYTTCFRVVMSKNPIFFAVIGRKMSQ